MANENALTAVQSFALAPISSEVTDLIKEELDGLGQIPFDTVKIPAGGSVTFELSGDDPDNPEVVTDPDRRNRTPSRRQQLLARRV